MGCNDENEIIRLSCSSCGKSNEGTFKELFGDLLSLIGMPKMVCKCGGEIYMELTGRYKAISNNEMEE